MNRGRELNSDEDPESGPGRSPDGDGGALGFGKSTGKRVRSEDSDTRMDDVAGSENAKKEITEVVEFLKDPARFRELGARIPSGILMMGPPGTGKALLRPGRFGRKITLENPHREARRDILKVHTKSIPLAGDARPLSTRSETT